jgi:carbon-monoxide dehydrogenase small subunit
MSGEDAIRPAASAAIQGRRLTHAPHCFELLSRNPNRATFPCTLAELQWLSLQKSPTTQKAHISFGLNGERTEVAFAPHKTLLEVLREDLGLTGTKHGCELGECGTCTVLVDGKSILSCLMLGLDAEDREVTTIEGMAENGRLHPLQDTFADTGAAQCGYCSPGFLLVAKELIDKNARPSRDEIKEALSGNLCRCTGYIKIYEAIELAAAQMRGEEMELPRESVYGLE